MMFGRLYPVVLFFRISSLFASSRAQAAVVSASSVTLTQSSVFAISSQSTPQSTNEIATQTASQHSTESRPASSMASSANSPGSTPQVHLVKAGAGGFVFKPNELTNVSVGDIITFEFYPPDHSVARAEFGIPCSPYEYTDKGKVGFWSGTQWVNTTDDVRKVPPNCCCRTLANGSR